MTEPGAKSFRLSDWFYPLWRNWPFALLSAAGALIVVILITLSTRPVYQASALLLIGEKKDLQGQLFDLTEGIAQKFLIKDQVAILESRSVAEAVVQRLLESPRRDSLDLLGNGRPFENPLRRWFGRVPVPAPQPPPKPSREAVIKAFMAGIQVSYGRDTDLIELRAESYAAWEAAYLVNTWIEVYQSYDRSDQRGEVTQTKLFLESKLNDMEGKLSASEKALSTYQKQNKVMSLSQETEQLVAQLSSFESLSNQTRTELEAVEKEHQFLTSQLDSSRRHLVEDVVKQSNPVLEALRREIASLVAEKAAYEGQLLGAGYSIQTDPKLLQMESRLKGLKDQIVREARKVLQTGLANLNPLDRSESLITQILQNESSQISLRSKAESLDRILTDYSRRMADLPDKSLELARLERDVQVNNKIYVMLREKYEETRIREASHGDLMRVVDPAAEPDRPVRPNPRLNLMLGCFFAFLLGTGVAYAKEYLNAAIRNADDLRRMNLLVIGEIPAASGRPRVSVRLKKTSPDDIRRMRAKDIFPELLLRRLDPAMVETYRSIRTTILLTRKRNRWKAVLVTSPNPGEGKSTTAANLAVLMARNGVKTLLVDGDLRRPVVDLLFTGSQRQDGLAGVLGGRLEWRSVVRETSIGHLYVLPAGAEVENAPELLGSERLHRFVDEAKSEYGIVLFDAPPVLPVTDATLLASILDGVILIVRAAQTRKDEVAKSVQTIRNAGGRLLGAIVTDVSRKQIDGYGGYYHG
jgi:polysaccharide biosynthesis transport protein